MSRPIRWLRGLPGSLQARVTLPFVLLSVAVFIFLYFFIGYAAERTFLENLRDQMANETRIAAIAVSQTPEDSASRTALIADLADRGNARVTLIAPDGTVLADSRADAATMSNHNDRPEVIAARENGIGDASRSSSTVKSSFLYVAAMVPNTDGEVVRFAVPIDQIDRAAWEIQRAILVAVAISLLATLLASWFFAGRMTRPLQELKRQVMRVAVGDYSVRVPPTEIDEIDSVGRAFNRIAGRLSEVTHRQEQVSLRLESVMEGLHDGVVLTNADGSVLRMNRVAELMLGMSQTEAIGKPFVQVARDFEMSRVLSDALGGKQNPSAVVTHGLDRQSIEVMSRVVYGAHEQLALIVLRDVTDLRRLEAVRREFVANVSHELRTPLTSIRALVETLEAGAVEEPEVAQEFLGRIVSEIERLNALVEDLLDFARLEAGRTPLHLEYVPIGEAIAAGADRLLPQIQRAGLDLKRDIAPDLPVMPIDVRRIEQVVINLIHNAIKFTPAGGTITISVTRRKNTIAVSVADTGIGIPVEEQARLFERFYKSDKARRSEGTGLGLAIAKNIVQLHGGAIDVHSVPGEGATFTFTLPLKRKKAVKRARRHVLSGLI